LESPTPTLFCDQLNEKTLSPLLETIAEILNISYSVNQSQLLNLRNSSVVLVQEFRVRLAVLYPLPSNYSLPKVEAQISSELSANLSSITTTLHSKSKLQENLILAHSIIKKVSLNFSSVILSNRTYPSIRYVRSRGCQVIANLTTSQPTIQPIGKPIDRPSSQSGLSAGVIAAIVISAIVGAFALYIAVGLMLWRRNDNRPQSTLYIELTYIPLRLNVMSICLKWVAFRVSFVML
jgi:hypothetical protein